MATVRSTATFLNALANASRTGIEAHRTKLLKQQVGQGEKRLKMFQTRLEHDEKIWRNTDALTFEQIQLKRDQMKKALEFAERDQKNEDTEADAREMNAMTLQLRTALEAQIQSGRVVQAKGDLDLRNEDSKRLRDAAKEMIDLADSARLLPADDTGRNSIPFYLSYARLLTDKAEEVEALEAAEERERLLKLQKTDWLGRPIPPPKEEGVDITTGIDFREVLEVPK